jgi:Tol biopolymer transport system component
MDSNGENIRQLSQFEGYEGIPAWSADGSKIAFTRDVGDSGHHAICTMTSDGTDLRQYELTGALLPYDSILVWSPDSKWLAFVCSRPGELRSDICVLSLEDGRVNRLTDNPGVDNGPSWSPGLQ